MYSCALHGCTRACWHLSIYREQKTRRKHREPVLYSSFYQRCTRVSITYVHDTPYTCTFLKNPNFADKYSLTVLYSSCCLRCTPAPFTTVLDTAGTCLFTENKKHSENIGKHYCTPLVSEAVFVHPSAVYSTHLTPVPSCRTQILQTKIGKHFL
jgi:hypothetical protein